MKFKTEELAALDSLVSQINHSPDLGDMKESLGIAEDDDRWLMLPTTCALIRTLARIETPRVIAVALAMEIGLALGLRLRGEVDAAKTLENILGVH